MTRENVLIFLVAVLIILCAIYLIRKFVKRRDYFSQLKTDCDDLYFHGYKLSQYISTEALGRLCDWAKENELRYGATILAMIALNDNPTATLCQGAWWRNDRYNGVHYWVEFEVPCNGTWVADFSWDKRCFYRKKAYQRMFKRDHVELMGNYRISNYEFWDAMPLTEVIYGKMLYPETSYLMKEVCEFKCFAENNWLGASGLAREPARNRTEDELRRMGTSMVPFECGSHVISDEIICDFVKKAKRLQPKERSIRVAMSQIKHRKECDRVPRPYTSF